MMNYSSKFYIFDLDGVLIEGKNLNRLPAFFTKDNCAFCTGRGFKRAYEVINQIKKEYDGYAILNNGSSMVLGKKIIYECPINEKSFIFLKDLNLDSVLFINSITKGISGYQYFDIHNIIYDNEYYEVDKLFYDINEYIAYLNSNSIIKITIVVNDGEKFIDNHFIQSGNNCYCINDYLVNKLYGIDLLCEYAGIKKENIVYFGNDHNDYPVFEDNSIYSIYVINREMDYSLLDLCQKTVLFKNVESILLKEKNMKYIISDVSGILTNKGDINYSLLETIKSLDDFDYSFVTGKGPLGVERIIDNRMDLPIICENGALLIDKDLNVLYKNVIDKKLVNELILFLSEQEFTFISICNPSTNKNVFLYSSKTMKLDNNIFFIEEYFNTTFEFINYINNIDVVRIVYCGTIDEEKFKIKYGNNIELAKSEKVFYNFTNKGVNKKFGVQKMAEISGIELKNCVLIGNDYNDIVTFDLECYTKICVSDNAPKELKEKSNICVTLDKLSELIEKLV
ncbi:MAG: HAD-IIB family hydrolase [Acholeplasmatales bacterium]|nr:HAD-IIB family hydrolase [Acholeplasmatales bacterium]